MKEIVIFFVLYSAMMILGGFMMGRAVFLNQIARLKEKLEIAQFACGRSLMMEGDWFKPPPTRAAFLRKRNGKR